MPRLSEHLDDFGLVVVVVALRSFYLSPSTFKTLTYLITNKRSPGLQFLVESSSWLIFVSTEIFAGEKQAEELGASLAAEMMFYAVASAVLANEVVVSYPSM